MNYKNTEQRLLCGHRSLLVRGHRSHMIGKGEKPFLCFCPQAHIKKDPFCVWISLECFQVHLYILCLLRSVVEYDDASLGPKHHTLWMKYEFLKHFIRLFFFPSSSVAKSFIFMFPFLNSLSPGNGFKNT